MGTTVYEDKHMYWPQCLDPDCLMTESASTWPTKADAIAAWNARAGSPAIDAGEVERLVDDYGNCRALAIHASDQVEAQKIVLAARASLLEYVSKGVEWVRDPQVDPVKVTRLINVCHQMLNARYKMGTALSDTAALEMSDAEYDAAVEQFKACTKELEDALAAVRKGGKHE